jgi:hypothetical protein
MLAELTPLKELESQKLCLKAKIRLIRTNEATQSFDHQKQRSDEC